MIVLVSPMALAVGLVAAALLKLRALSHLQWSYEPLPWL